MFSTCLQAYVGSEEATGADFTVEEQEDGPRPFQCLLDTGLKRTSTGSKVFAALKVGWPCLFAGVWEHRWQGCAQTGFA